MIQIIAARFTNCLAFACIYIELKTIKSTTFPTKILSPNMDAYCRGITRSSCKPVFGAQELCHSCVRLWERTDLVLTLVSQGQIWMDLTSTLLFPSGKLSSTFSSFKWILNTIFKLFTWTDIPLFFGITEQVLVDKKGSK